VIIPIAVRVGPGTTLRRHVGVLGGGRNLNYGSQAMGNQVLRPATFPDVFLKKHLKKGPLKGVEHLDRLVNDVLEFKTSVCSVFEQKC
jgi:hypothetical protein